MYCIDVFLFFVIQLFIFPQVNARTSAMGTIAPINLRIQHVKAYESYWHLKNQISNVITVIKTFISKTKLEHYLKHKIYS